ncbi:hypothetical protein [Burkholderia pyrrocinia]|uniref:hypothetical protein n=1 Tax=Burkholderia pyrrocinia TaxID=60550 RepID=UPI0013750DCF|nr:hypothetical protein [Burkholderia pyrrocinia]
MKTRRVMNTEWIDSDEHVIGEGDTRIRMADPPPPRTIVSADHEETNSTIPH